METNEAQTANTHGVVSVDEVERRRRTHLSQKAVDKISRGPGTYNPHPPLAEEVQKSSRNYAANFSSTPRYPEPSQQIDLDYNVDQGTKEGLFTRVQHSSMKYSKAFASKSHDLPKENEEYPYTYDPDCGVKTSLSTGVQKSPNKVSTMTSSVPRTQHVTESVDQFFDPDYGTKLSLATAVEQSDMKYSAGFNGTPRELKMTQSGMDDPLKYADNLDYGHQATIGRAVRESERKYEAAFKAQGRKSPKTPLAYNAEYDTQQYDIQRRAISTTRTYSTMKSQTPRFLVNPAASQGEHGDLELDAATKQGVSTKAEKSGLKYSHIFSSTPRFKEPVPEYTAKFYNVEFGNKKSVFRTVSDSNFTYSVMRSVTPRFLKTRKPNAPPLGTYDINQGNNMDVLQRVQTSERNYGVIKSTTPRTPRPPVTTTTGPGSYEPHPPPKDTRALSSMISKTPRDNRKFDIEANQARGVDIHKDNENWFNHGKTIPRAPRFKERKPDYDPVTSNVLEADKKNWHRKGLATAKSSRFPGEEIDAIIAEIV